MDKVCEWQDCEVLTHKRFCSQRCRERWQYNDPVWRSKKLSRNRAYNKANPEVGSRAQKKWYDNGGKAIRDAWREANRERYNELIAIWKLNNPEQNIIDCNRRRTRLLDRGNFTKEEWLALCEKYDFKCINCGAAEQHADHVIPLSKGGMNTIDNIQPLCRSCNSRKGTKATDYREPSPKK